MSKAKVMSTYVIKKASLWISSGAVIFIMLLWLLCSCNQNQYHAQKQQEFTGIAPPPVHQSVPPTTDANEPGDINEVYDDEIVENIEMDLVMENAPPADIKLAPPFQTEEYDRIYENEFQEVWQHPLSTFSIDVDNAAYSNIRRFIDQYHELPPKDAVRIEEMVNYFQYDYPQPSAERPFSITTELGTCPWNKDRQLLHIGIQGRSLDYDHLKPSNLVFLLDVSGSMDESNKLPLVKKSIKLLVNALDDRDKVSIVVYAGAAGVVLPATAASESQKIMQALNQLSAGGSTAGGEGIELAYQIASEQLIPDGNNRVILATDGDFNIGTSSTGELVRMIEEKRKMGIYLTICGFGMGNYKDSRMEQISNAGNGNYFYIDHIREAEKVFVREMRANLFTIAKDVKIQLEFNPKKVQKYRLIGYENRVMAREDFDNDQKDAGELGAGHSVTALYEIVPAAQEATASTDLRYQQASSTAASESDELMTLKLRYKPLDSDTSMLMEHQVLQQEMTPATSSDHFRFSAAVAGFGMLLQDSQYKQNLTFEQVIQLAQGKALNNDPEKAEFIALVRAASLLSQPD